MFFAPFVSLLLPTLRKQVNGFLWSDPVSIKRQASVGNETYARWRTCVVCFFADRSSFSPPTAVFCFGNLTRSKRPRTRNCTRSHANLTNTFFPEHRNRFWGAHANTRISIYCAVSAWRNKCFLSCTSLVCLSS